MARNYGRFTTSISRDEDFARLTRAQQGLYFMLGLQPEVSAAGTLPLTLRRWASTASGETVETVREQLAALEDDRHVVVDEGTEELLIVKFIKFDQGWYNEKRWPVVRDAIDAVASIHIRDIAVDELRRLAASGTQGDTACARVLDWLSARQSRFDRSGVALVGNVPEPHSATPDPGSQVPVSEPVVEDDPRSDFCIEHQPDGAPGPCQKCGIRRTANRAKRLAEVDAEAERRKATQAAIDACDLCDEKGMRLHPRSRLPLGRCNHEALELAGGRAS